jgi:hypothetical protein
MSKWEYNSIIEGMGDAVGVSPKMFAKRTVKFYPTVEGEFLRLSHLVIGERRVMWGGLALKRLSPLGRGEEPF